MSAAVKALRFAIGLLALGAATGHALGASGDGPSEMTVLKGACTERSHIAEGLQAEDLTKRQSRFFCNAAVIMHPNGDPKRVLITFTESQSSTSPQIGFAGTLPEPNMVQVSRVYLQAGVATAADDGACKIFRKDGRITSLVCSAKIDKGARRTVPVVAFEVAAIS